MAHGTGQARIRTYQYLPRCVGTDSKSLAKVKVRKRVLGPLVAEGFQEHTCIPPGPAADKERGQKSQGFGIPNPYMFVPVSPTPRALPVSTSVPCTPWRKCVLGPLVVGVDVRRNAPGQEAADLCR